MKKISEKETRKYKPEELKLEDKWILNKLDNLSREVTKNMEEL